MSSSLLMIYARQRGKADGSIGHGEFLPWLEKHCPGIPQRTAYDYIHEGNEMCERLGWQICEFRNFEVLPHQLITASADELSPKARKQQQMLLDLVDGKGKFTPIIRFQQMENGNVKRGRLVGEGGKPAAPTGSIGEIIQHNATTALRRMGGIVKELDALGIDFLSQPDDVLEAWLHRLDKAAKVARKWLDTPPGRRSPEEMEKLHQSL